MMEEEGILIGTRITLEIKNVPSKMKGSYIYLP